MSDEVSEQTGGHVLAKMAEGAAVTYREYSSVEEAIAAARLEIAAATRLPVHIKILVVVSDDQQRIEWAAASDGWHADYRPGSPPEMH